MIIRVLWSIFIVFRTLQYTKKGAYVAELSENELKERAIAYLLSAYGEETVSMDIKNNTVQDGGGELHVDCRVRIGSGESDWTKWFTFEDGEITRMRWQMR